ncbi:unnamed protein product [Vitrella brassicaformis CCMP3155]|uniref:Uncharacterized protein n=2 Tax=Vitrella brassicaformis TaxID=1169539 RepID=A0A0G4EWD8_VITBC|nr:unnamed protein product [Vitrella brassicaformis CCMP3155]|eukprot:CEM03272.1 unnamed protein product [Vitrella brassicaformis CCMP3155]
MSFDAASLERAFAQQFVERRQLLKELRQYDDEKLLSLYEERKFLERRCNELHALHNGAVEGVCKLLKSRQGLLETAESNQEKLLGEIDGLEAKIAELQQQVADEKQQCHDAEQANEALQRKLEAVRPESHDKRTQEDATKDVPELKHKLDGVADEAEEATPEATDMAEPHKGTADQTPTSGEDIVELTKRLKM